MTKIQIAIFIITLMAITVLISYLMEIYKKNIRHGKAKKWENLLVALVLSMLGTLFLYLACIMKPLLMLIGAPIWVDTIAYTVIFFIGQYELSMQVIKRLTKHLIMDFLKDKGFNTSEIQKIMEDKK